jgi:hypothetical protein
MTEELRLFLCECCDAALAVERWEPDEVKGLIGVGFWRWGHGGSAYDRLRHILHIFWHGHPWCDEVLLTPEKTRALAAHLLALAGTGKPTGAGMLFTDGFVDEKELAELAAFVGRPEADCG